MTQDPQQLAALHGYDFYWEVELLDGSVYHEYSGYDAGESGEDRAGMKPIVKDLLDPYPKSIVYPGVRSGRWMPALPHLRPFHLSLADGEDLVLYRRVCQWMFAARHVTYIIGKRCSTALSQVVENVVYICPPFDVLRSDGTSRGRFPGAISSSQDPLFQTPFDEFLKTLPA